jgi:phosphopantetheinyl transferase (holo-ACP synthase)
MELAEIIVHTINHGQQKRPVFYASYPCRPPAAITCTGLLANGEEAKHRLVSTLWDHLSMLERPLRNGCPSSAGTDFPIRVLRETLGRPRLLVGEYWGPAISFSEGGGRIWAALCADGSDIGIDAAENDEFQGAYPVQRVFHPEELEHALSLTGGAREEALALLWSIKEAVVKALGCGFHLVDPRQITVYPSSGGAAAGAGGHAFRVVLTGKARMSFPLASARSLRVHALPGRKMWLSIAMCTLETGTP